MCPADDRRRACQQQPNSPWRSKAWWWTPKYLGFMKFLDVHSPKIWWVIRFKMVLTCFNPSPNMVLNRFWSIPPCALGTFLFWPPSSGPSHVVAFNEKAQPCPLRLYFDAERLHWRSNPKNLQSQTLVRNSSLGIPLFGIRLESSSEISVVLAVCVQHPLPCRSRGKNGWQRLPMSFQLQHPRPATVPN